MFMEPQVPQLFTAPPQETTTTGMPTVLTDYLSVLVKEHATEVLDNANASLAMRESLVLVQAAQTAALVTEPA